MMEPTAEQQRVPSPRGRVTLLESDAERGRVLSAYLRREGFDVLSLEGPEEAEAAVDQGRTDLLLIGGEFVRHGRGGAPVTRVRRQRHGGRVPIVLMPSGVEVGPHESWATADLVLARPFQMGQLIRALSALRANGVFQRPSPDQPIANEDLRPHLTVKAAGTLDSTPFSEVFRALWQSAFTGSVGLKAGGTWRRVDFRNGFPVGARSNLLTEHLLRYLLRLGYITPDAYRELLPAAQDEDWETALGTLDPTALHPARLLEARRKLAEEIVLHCFKWHGASYQLRDEPPAAGDATIELNPFELYVAWLADPGEHSTLNRAFAALQARGLQAMPAFGEHAHLVSGFLEALPRDLLQFDGSLTAGRLAELLGNEPRARAAAIALVDLGALQPSAVTIRASTGSTTAPNSAPAGRKFERIRQMVAEDQSRVLEAESPFVVLGLAEGASMEEVRSQYLRFCRFYRPENFERIGEAELVEAAQELLEAFQDAAAALLGEAPEGPPISSSKRIPTQATLSQDDLVLAEVFFDDGSTYLRLGDWGQAYSHFLRAHQLSRNTPKYMTMLGWCTFHLDRRDPEQLRLAKDLLLAALKLDPRSDRALYYLGCLYEETGRLDRAVECWKKALRINSGNFDARAALRRHAKK